MRTFTFTDGVETKTVDAVSYKKAVKSYLIIQFFFSNNSLLNHKDL